MTLTPRQASFVLEYMAEPNATQAAIRAGYSAATAKQAGCRLLTRTDVRAALDERQRRLEVRATVTREMVINGLLGLATDDETPKAVRRAAWRDLGEHLAMFRVVVSHELVRELAESLGLDAADIQAEAEAILKGAR